MGVPDIVKSSDFGILLNETNIDAQLEAIRKSAEEGKTARGV